MKPIQASTAIAASLLCCSLAQTSQAQTVASPSSEVATLDKVIVTANKREQAAIDVPASVAAVSAERLTLGGVNRLVDFAAEVPGLSVIEQTRGQMAVVLRGISTGALQSTPTTAQYVDDAPVGSVNAYAAGATLTPDLNPADLQRIEVLKGPQGTLYGAGAVGGLLRYVSTPANTQSLSGVVSIGGSKISDGGSGANERFALNVPLVKDVLGLRVSAFNRDEPGYIDNPVTGKKNVNKANMRGGRIALDWKLDSDWTVKAWALTQKLKADGYGSEDVVAPTLTPLTGELQRSTWVPEPQTMTLDLGNVSVKGRLGNFELVSSTTWQKNVAETSMDTSRANSPILEFVFGVPGLGVQSLSVITTRRASQEFRARSSALNDTLDFDFGMFLTQEKSSYLLGADQPIVMATGEIFPIPGKLADIRILSKYQEVSAFGNATYALTSSFDLMGGLRLSKDKQHFDQNYLPTLASPAAALVVQDVSKQHTSWMVGARYKPMVNTNVYVRAASAYRPGGPNALPPGILPSAGTSFEPDSLVSYELGFKSVFLEGKASVEAALFSTDWKKIQLQTSAQGPTIAYNYFTNGGTAKSKGAEATLIWAPVAGLTLRTGGAYTDAHLSSDAPAAGGVSGDVMPYTPKWSGSLGATYDFAIASHKAWVGSTLNFIGARQSDFSKHLTATLPSYTTLNANAGMDIDNWQISLFVRNITDKRGFNFAQPAGFQHPILNPTGNPYSVNTIQPRTIGADVSYRF